MTIWRWPWRRSNLRPIRLIAVACVWSFGFASTIAPTYLADVRPILAKNCSPCHAPGSVAPFALRTYEDAFRWRTEIAAYAARRAMPPINAEGGPFDGVAGLRLTDHEIKALQDWALSGAPKGEGDDLPIPTLTAERWTVGRPDIVLKAGVGETVGATGEEAVRTYRLPFGREIYIRSVDVLPSAPKSAHHLQLFWRKGADQGFVGAWTSGFGPMALGAGVAVRAPRGSQLVARVQYLKTGREENAEIAIGLVADQNRPIASPKTLFLGSGSRLIADSCVLVMALPVDGKAGKPYRLSARHLSGQTETLVSLQEWNPKWTETFHFQRPRYLARGSVIASSSPVHLLTFDLESWYRLRELH